MWKLISYYKNLLIDKEKKILLFVFILSVIASLIETFSIGIIPIYLLSIIDLESIINFSPDFLKKYILLINDEIKIIFYSSIIILFIFIIKNVLLYIINILIMTSFLTIREGLMYRSAKHFININYQIFLNLNSANVVRNITGESLNTSNCLRDFLLLFQEISLILFIIIFSSLIYPEIILPGIGIIILISLLFIFFTKKYLKKLGEMNVKLRGAFIRTVNHIYGSFKEIKIFKNETYMLSFFKKNLSNEINNIKKINAVSIIPKYLIEIFVIASILFILSFFLIQDQEIQNHLPMLTLFASALIKVMPSMIRTNQIISKISTTHKSVEIINDLKNLYIREKDSNYNKSNSTDISFKNEISIQSISFKYTQERGDVINNLNLKINKNTLTLITGSSGSGKSTLIELLTGILKPSNGKIKVDGLDINKNIVNWQSNISYMPQDIYLLDDTILNNLVFDFNKSDIKDEINEIIKKVNLYDLINKLPNKYNEILGEKAKNFSGGQIKRFGLARCLVKKRPILILDEPTAGLDKENTDSLIKLIKNISTDTTVVVVSHNNDFEKVSDNVLNLNNQNKT